MSAVHIGTSVLTRDLVWCECGRGLSLSGKWLYCPSCGARIDQESYLVAVEQARHNGARPYRDPEEVERQRELLDIVKYVRNYAMLADLGPGTIARMDAAIAEAEK